MPSFFSDKTAVAYKVTITSFDDDYYYGTFYREYEKGFKQFIGNVYIDLDDDANDYPHTHLFFSNEIGYDRELFTDFELDDVEQDASQLEDAVSRIVTRSARVIYRAVKQDGKTIDLIIEE